MGLLSKLNPLNWVKTSISGIKAYVVAKGAKSVARPLAKAIIVPLFTLIATWLAANGAPELAEQILAAMVHVETWVAGSLVVVAVFLLELIENASTVPTTPKTEAAALGVEYAIPPKKPEVIKH